MSSARPFPEPHDIHAHLVPRHLVWERACAYRLPVAEYARVGGAEGLRMARNHRDTRTRMGREVAAKILGELELDRRHPAWGEHCAALAGVQDARLHDEYHAATTVAEARRMHYAVVFRLGGEILRDLGL